MNVLLLGNGFDMYYRLPTKYANFLHVVHYLVNNDLTNKNYIGDIFSDLKIQSEDNFIKECYNSHQEVFDNTPLDLEKITELVTLTKDNKWFLYLLKSFDKDVGWIDFEKEIAMVIECFKEALPIKGKRFRFKNDAPELYYIIKSFDFLLNKQDSSQTLPTGSRTIKSEYCLEQPLHSKNIVVNLPKVVEFLYAELTNLAKALKLYLECFVENAYSLLYKDGKCKRLDIFNKVDVAVTFNYTNTYEKLYFDKNAFHIHGNTNSEIVLGINSDLSDKQATVDTSFISFKKYFQRVVYETDFDYLSWIQKIKKSKEQYILIIMGHSLDVTDKDIISEMFKYAREIIVLYHSKNAKKSYIANLVELFGEEEFDRLRKEKNLNFLPLDGNFTELAEKMENEHLKKRQVIRY